MGPGGLRSALVALACAAALALLPAASVELDLSGARIVGSGWVAPYAGAAAVAPLWEYSAELDVWATVSSDERDGTEEDMGGTAAAAAPGQEALVAAADALSVPLPGFGGDLSVYSDVSLWVVGRSGSVFERFWNGMHWVYIPHSLPLGQGGAVSIVCINSTVLVRLRNGGVLQRAMGTDRKLTWKHVGPQSTRIMRWGSSERSLYAISDSGELFQVAHLRPYTKWVSHRFPRGAPLRAVVAVGDQIADSVFAISGTGDLYEFEPASGRWRHHPRPKSATGGIIPARGARVSYAVDESGTRADSIFMRSRNNRVLERRYTEAQGWRWHSHPAPANGSVSLVGSVADIVVPDTRAAKKGGWPGVLVFGENGQAHTLVIRPGVPAEWSTLPPPSTASAHAHLAPIRPIELGPNRRLYLADDGRLAEHSWGIKDGGDGWVLHDVPELEGGDAECCTPEKGPANCLQGTRLEQSHSSDKGSSGQWRDRHSKDKKGSKAKGGKSRDERATLRPIDVASATVNTFKLRAMVHKSLFIVTPDGDVMERYWNGKHWVWLSHHSDQPIAGILAVYNGTVVVLDTAGQVLVRERFGNSLRWLKVGLAPGAEGGGLPYGNGTVKVTGSSATDQCCGPLGQHAPLPPPRLLFFVGEDGELKELAATGSRPPRWGNAGAPPSTGVAAIADAGMMRAHSVFIVGKDGTLHQYNLLNSRWTDHGAPPNAPLSQLAACHLRSVLGSQHASLFLRAEDGTLVERRYDAQFPGSTKGSWTWIERGTPVPNVALTAAPGPSIGDRNVFVVGDDGNLYELTLEDGGKPTWYYHGQPPQGPVAPVRGISLSTQELVFALEDGRLATRQWSWLGGAANGAASGAWSWLVLDAPGVESGDADFPSDEPVVMCTAEPGPHNCVAASQFSTTTEHQ